MQITAPQHHLRLDCNHHYELECAKRAVEIAIEQDEQTAIDYLENETQVGNLRNGVEDFRNGEVTK